MKSTFSYSVFIVIFIIFPIVFGMNVFVLFAFLSNDPTLLIMAIPVTIIACFTLGWLIFGELRTKIIRVELGFDHLTIRRYGGLSAPLTFYYADLDGFTTSILPSERQRYEYLYLLRGGKKIGKLSEYYHKNYADLKDSLSTNLNDLGSVEFSYWLEIKESFGG